MAPRRKKGASQPPSSQSSVHSRSEVSATRQEKSFALFESALAFARDTHPSDCEWIKTRQVLLYSAPLSSVQIVIHTHTLRKQLVESFDDFFTEYTYVVVASGFKGATAARFTPLLVACKGDEEALLGVFKNKRKTHAMASVYSMRDKWDSMREEYLAGGVDSLEALPYIGSTTKYHLARNIGLLQCAKPDLHLLRFCSAHGWGDGPDAVRRMVQAFADHSGIDEIGYADFVLWIWLSHGEGQERPCCHGGYALR
ncbi:hypothetical protein KIPB_001283 [Kipferlia bialata]|uniref:DNA glycosylase n=1 Tax=Kipferlia bialata TaxID=797122 RepID=A0A9K3CRU6_9EUKA|nr:hypothetical protein KIPB_001283 [Kipferlia bialata]|eukprot:g1283.t1